MSARTTAAEIASLGVAIILLAASCALATTTDTNIPPDTSREEAQFLSDACEAFGGPEIDCGNTPAAAEEALRAYCESEKQACYDLWATCLEGMIRLDTIIDCGEDGIDALAATPALAAAACEAEPAACDAAKQLCQRLEANTPTAVDCGETTLEAYLAYALWTIQRENEAIDILLDRNTPELEPYPYKEYPE